MAKGCQKKQANTEATQEVQEEIGDFIAAQTQFQDGPQSFVQKQQISEKNESQSKNVQQQETQSSSMSQTPDQVTESKNKKKKQNKKNAKMRKDIQREFIQRHVSPDVYKEVVQKKVQAEISLINFNQKYAGKQRDQVANEESSKSDSDNASDEDFEDFKIDGYHPIHQNEILDAKYLCLRKLGWGHFSTVWLALKLQDKNLYALKIQKSAQKYTESALEEEEILYDVASNYRDFEWEKSVKKYLRSPNLEVTRQHTHNLQMFDQFFHIGPNGRHSIMALEVLGKNMLSVIKKYEYGGIPIPIVREITRQTLMGLDYLHRICKIIHTDLKPENVVFALSERQSFEMLYRDVLSTPLVQLYDYNEPIALNKKQLKNQKKNQKKKQKRQQMESVGVKNEFGKTEEEEETEENKQPSKQTRTDQIVKQMRQKLTKEEEKFKDEHVFKIRRNAISQERPFRRGSQYTKFSLLEDPENWAEKIIAFEHPLKSYRTYLKKQASGFESLKQKCGEDLTLFQDLKEKEIAKVKTHLRVRSQRDLYRSKKARQELKPLDSSDLKKIADLDFNIKLCDMGNACYIDNHYSDVIQTREYRGPEVILDGQYDESADLWSLACMVFELVTGDYLFDPRRGKTYKKNDDHLALIEELIGPCKDLRWLKSNEKFEEYFTPQGKLQRIQKLKPWRIQQVLEEKYRMKTIEAAFLAKFLEKMLKWKPKDRPTAQQMLNDPWLKMQPEWDTYMSRQQSRELKKAKNPNYEMSVTSESQESEDEEESVSVKEEDDSNQEANCQGNDDSWEEVEDQTQNYVK